MSAHPERHLTANPSAAADLCDAWLEAEKGLMTFDAQLKARSLERQEAIESALLAAAGGMSGDLAAARPAARDWSRHRAAHRPTRIVIVGAGIGGLCMAARLREAGYDDFVILEKATDLGGTWNYNQYPGLACDIASHIYSLPFFPNAHWSQKNASGAEIKAYLNGLSDHYCLRERIQFGRTVSGCVYRQGRWRVATADGGTFPADILICASGILHIPRPPRIDGVERFAGPAFHSSGWPAALDIDGRRIGIIGTGSSGVQIVPNVVSRVAKLAVFQRTAQWILPVANDRYSERRRRVLGAYPQLLKWVFDIQLQAFNQTVGKAVAGDRAMQQLIQSLCDAYLQTVRDPDLRMKLTPSAGTEALCKRQVMSDSYYEALQHPHCELITGDIAAIEAEGVRTADGVLHALDILIFATGFDSHAYCRHLNISVADGPTLHETWAKGARAHDSVAVAGFPNLFLIGGPYSPVGNLSTMICSQLEADYIIRALSQLESRQGLAIVPKLAAEQQFVDDMQAAAARTTWMSGCTSWYLDAHGKLDMWTKSPEEYMELMKRGPCPSDYDVLTAAAALPQP